MKTLLTVVLAILTALTVVLLMASASTVFGQVGAMMPNIYPVFNNVNGVTPVANGFVCTTLSGGSVLQATFREDTNMTANQNPIPLNSSGRAVNGSTLVPIYLAPVQYRITLYAAGTGNTCNSVTVGSLIWQQDNVYDFGELLAAGLINFTSITTGALNNREFCTTGANFGAKFTAAAALLPSTGGIVDCSNLQGAQTAASDVWTGITKPIRFIPPSGTLTPAVSFSSPPNILWDYIQSPGILAVTAGLSGALGDLVADKNTQHFVSGSAMSGGSLQLGPGITEIYPQWWGASGIGDSSDQWAAFRSAIDSMQTFPGQASSDYTNGTTLTVPHGKYQLNTELRIDRTMTMRCGGGGAGSHPGCELDFPANSASQSGGTTGNGILVIRHAGGTGGDGTGTAASPESYALSPVIDGFYVNSLATTGGTGVGIGITGTAIVTNNLVNNFPNHGIYVQSKIPAIAAPWDQPGSELITPIAPSSLGGAGGNGGPDNFYLGNNIEQNNRGDGLHFVGGDSNNGTVVNNNSIANRCGYWDQVGIGTTYVNPVSQVNTLCSYRIGVPGTAGSSAIIGGNLAEGNGTSNIGGQNTLFLNALLPTLTAILAGSPIPFAIQSSTAGLTVPGITAIVKAGTSGASFTTQNWYGNTVTSTTPSLQDWNQVSSGGAPIGNRLTALRYNDTKLCYEYWNVTSIAIFDLCTFDSATANTVGFPNGGVFKPLAFSSLPGCTSAYEGMTQAINDAALGAGPTWAQGTVVSVGAGTGHVLVFCNGTNWVTAQNDVKPIHSVPHWNEPPEAEENYANI